MTLIHDYISTLIENVSADNWSDFVNEYKEHIKRYLDVEQIPCVLHDILDRTLEAPSAEVRKEYLQMIPVVLETELTKTSPEQEVVQISERDSEYNTQIEYISEDISSTSPVNRDHISLDDALEIIYDLSLPVEECIRAVEIVCAENPQEFEQVFARLVSMLQFSNVSMLCDYILQICTLDIIPYDQKLSAISTLCQLDLFSKDAYSLLAQLCETRPMTCPLVLYMEHVYSLILFNKETYIYLFDNTMLDDALTEQERYSYIVKSRTVIGVDFWIEYIHKCLRDEMFSLRYRIIACSDLLQFLSRDTYKSDCQVSILNYLCSWMNDNTLEMNLRADAADTVLRYGRPYNLYKTALDTLMTMGTDGLGVLSTLYDNAQNIHFTNSEHTVKSIMERLVNLDVQPSNTSMDDIRDSLYKSYFGAKKSVNKDELRAFNFSLFRIENQVGKVVGKYTLKDIFLHVYGYIEENRYQSYIESRLVEELIDMSDTCTSGYYSRLVNTLQGYGPFGMTINWGDQIQANLIGRLRACIRDDEKLDDILDELTEESFEKKPELRRIYLSNISRIREELSEEFKNYISAEEFDLFFRKSLLHFEGGNN